ncbi:MAG: UDP-N-acetylmuramoyl-L-alanine--D-glutamate ligase [Nitrospirales bacterium]|nr:UDP-N-acetylmuramoyl-L-alanine--D-glutamate ligase [Nitrospirales bacterium]
MEELKGKAVTVLGLARSGVGAARLLERLGAHVTVNDRKSPQELDPYLARLGPGIRHVLGGHPPELFEEPSLIVVSPGVPLTIAPLKRAMEKGVKIIGELELAYQAVAQGLFPMVCEGDRIPAFLAVTGANGKSTTTTLLYEMLKENGTGVMVGGNIGNALTEELLKAEETACRTSPGIGSIVAEISSFQLETIDTFRPRGAAILNITPDHLDRYHSMQEYIDAKCRIFENQEADDFLVLNADDPVTAMLEPERLRGREKGLRVFFFSRRREVSGAYYREGLIRFALPERAQVSPSFTLDPASFRIRGVHNIENAMAASLMALLSGCSEDAVRRVLTVFPGLEHRLEFVRERNGVQFINDSKGTNVGAVIKSLESFSSPVVLIAGGRDKDGDFTLLRPLIEEKVKALVLIGEAREKIRKAVNGGREVFMTDDFGAAVRKARDLAAPGDVVLLSPACASFDMFRDFEDRGRQFRKIVEEL